MIMQMVVIRLIINIPIEYDNVNGDHNGICYVG